MDPLFELELDLFQKGANEIIKELFNDKPLTETNLETNRVKAAKQDIIQLMTDHNFDTKEIANILLQKGLSSEKVNYFINLLDNKKTDLLYQSLAYHNSKYGETITSFNWHLKLVLGTSELTALRYPVLQLVLNTMDVNGKQNKLLFDVDKKMVNNLIETLEEINEP